MARSIVSLGMRALLASEMARRSRGFAPGSPPPSEAATVIALETLVQILPRLASMASFLRLIFAQWECPAIFSKSPFVLKLGVEAEGTMCPQHDSPQLVMKLVAAS